jgi:hypothetical protein
MYIFLKMKNIYNMIIKTKKNYEIQNFGYLDFYKTHHCYNEILFFPNHSNLYMDYIEGDPLENYDLG